MARAENLTQEDLDEINKVKFVKSNLDNDCSDNPIQTESEEVSLKANG